MKIELENQDIESITQRVIEVLKLFIGTGKEPEDAVFDKEGLATYLHVDVSWIDKHIGNRAIPHFHAGKYVRFQKGRIDRWIEDRMIEPIPELKRYQRR
jgi:hypothetical protein